MKLKERIFYLIDGGDRPRSLWNRIIELSIITLITLSVLQIILESFQPINERYQEAFWIFEVIVVIVFTLEYLIRLWTADLVHPELSPFRARLAFAFSGYGLIDLAAILPFYLPFLLAFDLRFIRILRVVRLLRIFKLNRYTKAIQIVGNIFWEKRTELSITVFVTMVLILMSSTVMYHLENEVQPEQFPDIISTFWWAIATLTTVGYGDVFPVTGWGKLVSGVIAMLGIGLVALPTGIISAAFIERVEEEVRAKKKQEQKHIDKGFTFCPHCGERLRPE